MMMLKLGQPICDPRKHAKEASCFQGMCGRGWVRVWVGGWVWVCVGGGGVQRSRLPQASAQLHVHTQAGEQIEVDGNVDGFSRKAVILHA